MSTYFIQKTLFYCHPDYHLPVLPMSCWRKAAKRSTTCEVKVMCQHYCLRHALRLFISRLTLFEKNIIMSNKYFMANDLERRLYDTKLSWKIQNVSCIWRRGGFGLSLLFIPNLQSAVCILYLVCILYPVCSLQSAVCSLQSAFYTDWFLVILF